MERSALRHIEYFYRSKSENFVETQKYLKQKTNDELLKELFDWKDEQDIISQEYLTYLDYLGLEFKDSNCAELDKNEFDTLVRPFDTKIISSYAEEITGVGNNRLIDGIVLATEEDDEKIYLVQPNAKGLQVIPKTLIDTYMTQNPLTIGDAFIMANIHNKGVYNYILGFYGNRYDKDKKLNEEMIRELEQFLKYDYNIDYETNKDHYFYVISTPKSKVLNKVKTLVR